MACSGCSASRSVLGVSQSPKFGSPFHSSDCRRPCSSDSSTPGETAGPLLLRAARLERHPLLHGGVVLFEHAPIAVALVERPRDHEDGVTPSGRRLDL
jgi:hypothetical protein